MGLRLSFRREPHLNVEAVQSQFLSTSEIPTFVPSSLRPCFWLHIAFVVPKKKLLRRVSELPRDID